MADVQYIQTIGQDGLPYISAVDNRYFYYQNQDPIMTGYSKRGSMSASNDMNETQSSSGSSSASSIPKRVTVAALPPKPSRVNPNRRSGVGFDRSYMNTWYRGIIRSILIIALLGTWISAATIRRTAVYSATSIMGADNLGFGNIAGTNRNSHYTDFESTRLAMLVISIAAFIVSSIIFFFRLFGVNHMAAMKRINIKTWIAGIDLIFLICILVLSIVCSVREGQLTNQTISVNYVDIRNFYNRGAFAATAFFGFLSSIFYTIIIIAYAITNKHKRARSKQRSQYNVNDLTYNVPPQPLPPQHLVMAANPAQIQVTKKVKTKKSKKNPKVKVTQEVIKTSRNPQAPKESLRYDITETIYRQERHITEEI